MPKAEWKRQNLWLRLALVAPTKAGKTAGALAVATHLFDGKLPITLVDTEYERAKLYANVFEIAHYRTITGNYSPDTFVKEIDQVEAENPGGILIIDSVTHEWNNTGGVLEIADKGKGSNWKEASPAHHRFTNRIANCQMHVIVCVRAKMKYDWTPAGEDGARRVNPQKLGVGPEQRDNFLYDYDVEGDIDLETHLCSFLHRAEPGRPSPLNGTVMSLIPKDSEGNLDPAAPNPVADILTKWLSEGEALPPPPEAATDLDIENLRGLLTQEGFDDEKIERGFTRARSENRGVLTVEYVIKQTDASLKRLEKKAAEEVPVAETTKAAESAEEYDARRASEDATQGDLGAPEE